MILKQQLSIPDSRSFLHVTMNLIQIASPELLSFLRKAASDFAYDIGGNIYHKRLYTIEGKQFPSSFYKFYRLEQSHDNMMKINST